MERNTIKEDKSTNADVSFSPQEVAIGAELSRNTSYKEIARKTSLSPKMVAYYMSTMMKKTGTSSKKELAVFFRKNETTFVHQKESQSATHNNSYSKLFLILFLISLFIYIRSIFFQKIFSTKSSCNKCSKH